MSAPRLQPGEQIIFTAHPSGWATSGYYIWTLGLWAFWRNATTFTVTDRRVIQAKGRITKSVRSGPLPMVQDATVKTSLGAGSVILSSAAARCRWRSSGRCAQRTLMRSRTRSSPSAPRPASTDRSHGGS